VSDEPEALRVILSRRSVPLVRPDPLPRTTVERLLRAAVAAPSHHLTRPWRFVVMAGDARRALGDAHARAVARVRPDATPQALAKERSRPERAPVVVACIATPAADDPVARREDRDAVVCAVENLLLAAHALGVGAMWRTGAMADEPEVRDHLGLGPRDEVVAFVYLGLPADAPPRAVPPASLEGVVEWRGAPTA
jgi:nitroreductase